MFKSDVINFYGTKAKVAKAAGVDPSAVSQWGELVPEGRAMRLQEASGGELEKPHHQLVSAYSELNRQYASLLEEYKSLRRYFSVSVAVPYTDVWTHKPVQYYPGKHPCEKPADMLRQIITASSRPGDLVADFFMGSGSTIKAALSLGRRAIGIELESERFEQTVSEIREVLACKAGD
ncbi:TPA: site-specific DNA-methyltransferase [Escherichia coli]|nr:site-specific DNA-methyltransferase [Escherichia coli]